MKITTLIENHVCNERLMAEHGLSILIETTSKKILFDTGQTGKFISNAGYLGIDVSEIDDVVISHGHYDHTGGLYEFIKHNKKAVIHIKKETFNKKFRANKKDYIGIPYEYELFSSRINYIKEKTMICNGVYIIPEIKIYDKNDLHYGDLLVERNGKFEIDNFSEEQFLVIEKDGYVSVISGCSHNGIINILETAKNVFAMPLNLVLGGFHTDNAENSIMEPIINCFKKFDPQSIGVSHCTGIEKFSILKNRIGEKIFYNYTGKIINI
jgi:7,8-dihydropterin-6-yl-methyl-4-(beta-D-ribofuranosyl)aminobenzene 5'-phosphate synthase